MTSVTMLGFQDELAPPKKKTDKNFTATSCIKPMIPFKAGLLKLNLDNFQEKIPPKTQWKSLPLVLKTPKLRRYDWTAKYFNIANPSTQYQTINPQEVFAMTGRSGFKSIKFKSSGQSKRLWQI